MNYHRFFIPNSQIFTTIVTSRRRKILLDNIDLLKKSLKRSMQNYNCKIIAICVMPEHLHMVIKPYKIEDYPYFIKQFKTYFSKNINILTIENYNLSKSNINKKERDIWQRRFWEHTIRNKEDLYKHIDYIHFNPMKHYNILPKNWEYSSFKHYTKKGYYDDNWCNAEDKYNILKMDYE